MRYCAALDFFDCVHMCCVCVCVCRDYTESKMVRRVGGGAGGAMQIGFSSQVDAAKARRVSVAGGKGGMAALPGPTVNNPLMRAATAKASATAGADGMMANPLARSRADRIGMAAKPVPAAAPAPGPAPPARSEDKAAPAGATLVIQRGATMSAAAAQAKKKLKQASSTRLLSTGASNSSLSPTASSPPSRSAAAEKSAAAAAALKQAMSGSAPMPKRAAAPQLTTPAGPDAFANENPLVARAAAASSRKLTSMLGDPAAVKKAPGVVFGGAEVAPDASPLSSRLSASAKARVMGTGKRPGPPGTPSPPARRPSAVSSGKSPLLSPKSPLPGTPQDDLV